jgi:osmotically-inducible protein OsmY
MRILRTLAAAVLASVAAATFAQGPYPGDDEQIFREVQRAIAGEPSLAQSNIDVEIRAGVVTLRGFARTMDDIATAGSVARRVSGVSAVDNRIRIAIRPSRA